jgi:4-amino-4-deoxy-L-arabinose transferase-like glycosyltransferase
MVKNRFLNKPLAISVVLALTLWRAYTAATLPLHPDEAYYWLWSRHLALSYFDHPPMIAYLIKLATLFSQAELWVRLPGLLVSVACSIFLWRLAKDLFERDDIAAASVILLNVYPVTMAGSIIISPDVPAFLFWTASLWAFWRIIKTGNAAWWYVLGVMFGMSLLSKYTCVLLGPALLAYLVFSEDRKWLTTIHPYLASVLALLVFSPVIIWNYSHEWLSFAFQLSHGIGGSTYKLSRFFDYVGGQLLVASPFIWLLGIWASGAFFFRKDKRMLFLAITSLPIVLFFGYSALKKPGEANWPAMAYVSMSIAVCAYFLDGGRVRRGIFIGAVIFAFLLSGLTLLHARFTVLPLAKYSPKLAYTDATNWFWGWREIGSVLESRPDTKIIIVQSHQAAAEIIYYTHETIPVCVDKERSRFSQFNLWGWPQGLEGQNGVYLLHDDQDESHVTGHFKTLSPAELIPIYRKNFPIRTYQLYSGTGYLHP